MFEVSDLPSTHTFETEKDKQQILEEIKEEENEDGTLVVKSKEKETKIEFDIAQISISLINKNVEVLTFVMDNLISVIY